MEGIEPPMNGIESMTLSEFRRLGKLDESKSDTTMESASFYLFPLLLIFIDTRRAHY